VRLSLNEVFLGQPLSFTQYIALADECGYEGVDLYIDKVADLNADDVASAAQTILTEYGIEATAWWLPME